MGKSYGVTATGPFFTKLITPTVKAAIVEETLNKVDERMARSAAATRSKGHVLVANPRNRVTRSRADLTWQASSTLLSLRRKGTSWIEKHVGSRYGKGIIPAMLPVVIRKTADRIIGDLN